MTTHKRLWLLASWFVIGSGICPASGSPVADLAAAIRMNLQWADSAFSDRPSLLPYSFVYNGQDSSQLVKRWPREVKDEVIDGGRRLRTLVLTDPETRLTDYLNAAIKAYKLSCLRIDFNEFDPLTFWRSIDAKDPNRVGMAEIRYVEGLYRMWDDILQANPRLFIDNCASGGRRIDLETMSRSIPLWRSDNTDDMLDHNPATVMLAAIKNQVMSAGLNRYVPWSTAGQMGAAPYLFRSGFNAGIAFAEDVRPNGYPRELLMQGIAEGKRIRKYYFGNFYPLSPVTTSPKDWCVLQYHRTKEQDGMVVAFRRPESPDADFVGGCREIDPAAEYEVTRAYSYELSPPSRVKGAELCSLKLHVEQCPGSVVVEYRKLKP